MKLINRIYQKNPEPKYFQDGTIKKQTKYLPRTLVPEEIQIDDAIHNWIINWEMPKHQIEKAYHGRKKLRINYHKELEDRTKKYENRVLRYNEPTISHYQHKDIDLDHTFSHKQYKRGMHPNSQTSLSRIRKQVRFLLLHSI